MTNEQMARILERRADFRESLYDSDDKFGEVLALRAGVAALRREDRIISQRAINIARGCFDYLGGHSGDNLRAFHHGVGTVVECLERAAAGDDSYQIRVVESIGRELPEPIKKETGEK